MEDPRETDRLLAPSNQSKDALTPQVHVINDEPRGEAEGQHASYGTSSNGPLDPNAHPDDRDSAEGKASGSRDQDGETKAPAMTRRQKLTFLGVALTYLSSLMSFSVLAPFFPYEAEKKGVTPSETGFVFGLFALVSFISAPILGKFLPLIGGKFMFLSGSFVGAGCNILFGFLDGIHGTTLFLSYCFVIRFVEALGSSATITAGMAIVTNSFPENVAQMAGMLELFSGLGFALGPPLGSLFYGIGGYRLPFIVLGCTAMVVAILNMFILPGIKSEAKDEKAGSLLSVAKIPAVWVVLVACTVGSASLGFCDPTLSLHMTSPPLNVKPSMVGYLFLLIGGMYGVTAPIWGYIADKKKTTRIMMVVGFYLIGISFLLIGPCPLLNLPSTEWLVIFALALLGFSIGIGLMPAFLDLLISAKWYGLPDDLSTQAVISGVFTGAFSFGTFLGPTLAGVLLDHLGFDWSASVFAGLCFVVMILMCLFGVWEYQCGKGRRKPKHLSSEPYPEIQDGPLVVNT